MSALLSDIMRAAQRSPPTFYVQERERQALMPRAIVTDAQNQPERRLMHACRPEIDKVE